MAIYSVLGKSLIALMVVGGGVTGTGASFFGSKEVQEGEKVNLVTPQADNSTSEAEQDTDLSRGQEVSHQLAQRKELQLEQSPKQGEKAIESKAQESTSKALEQEKTSPISSPEKDLSKTDQLKVDQATENKKESPAAVHKNQLSTRSTKSPRRPRRQNRRERPSPKQELMEEPLSVKEDDSLNKNWFLLKWDNQEDLDDSEWKVGECTPNIKGDVALFACPWNEDPDKMIELNLDLSADEALKGKKWSDLEELSFSHKAGNLASLELTFADERDQMVTLFLKGRKA